MVKIKEDERSMGAWPIEYKRAFRMASHLTGVGVRITERKTNPRLLLTATREVDHSEFWKLAGQLQGENLS